VNSFVEQRLAQDYNRGFGIIRHNIPKVAANNSFGILRNLTGDNKAIVFTKLLFVAGK